MVVRAARRTSLSEGIIDPGSFYEGLIIIAAEAAKSVPISLGASTFLSFMLLITFSDSAFPRDPYFASRWHLKSWQPQFAQPDHKTCCHPPDDHLLSGSYYSYVKHGHMLEAKNTSAKITISTMT